jgi:hypothetical protein
VRTYHRDIVPVLLCLAGAREDLADYARAGADYRRADDILQQTNDPHDLEAQRCGSGRSAVWPASHAPSAGICRPSRC